MRNRMSARYLGVFLKGAVISLFTTLVLTGTAQAAIQCYECHGVSAADYRPIDTPSTKPDSYRNMTTGAFKGNHQTHMGVIGSQALASTKCADCHGRVTSSGHRTGFINMTGNINSSPVASPYNYSRGKSFAQSSTPALGTCATVNCHFERTTPKWGTAAWNPATDCDSCHGAPPAGVVLGNYTGGFAGSHSAHNSYYPGISNCQKCHSNNATFAHATSVKPGHALNVSGYIKDPKNNTSGTYSRSVDYPTYLPSAGLPAWGSCATLYCHSQGQSTTTFTVANAPKATATWNGTMPANCAGCHGGTRASGANTMLNVGHDVHTTMTSVTGKRIGCNDCHSATTSTGTTITNKALHVDRNITIQFNTALNKDTDNTVGPIYNNGSSATSANSGATKTPGNPNANNTCSNIYCHSTGQSRTATDKPRYKSVAWNAAWTAGKKCTACHGNAALANVSDGTKAHNTYSGSHVIHVEYRGATVQSFACSQCHARTTSDPTGGYPTLPTSVITGGSHLGRVETVSMQNIQATGTNFTNMTGTYSNVTRSCSKNTYCHSTGANTTANKEGYKAVTWGGARLYCQDCHGSDAKHTNAINTGLHGKHINPSLNAELGTDNGFNCGYCHAKTVAQGDQIVGFNNNTTILNRLTHVNKMRDYSGALAPRSSYNSATLNCTAFYCHSNGKIGTAAYKVANPGYAWNAASVPSQKCNYCHGTQAATAPLPDTTDTVFTKLSSLGAPNYVSGGVATATANSHKMHVQGAVGTVNSKVCYDCHRRTLDRTTAAAVVFRPFSTTHSRGSVNVSFAPAMGATAAYNSTVGTKQCSNIYCHGAGTPQWGGAALACNSCHSSSKVTGPPANYWNMSSSHRQHIESATLPTKFTNYSGNVSSAAQYRFTCYACHGGTTVHADGAKGTNQAAQVFFTYTATGRVGTWAIGAAVSAEGTLKYTDSTCTATYCHSDGKGGNPLVAAFNWKSADGVLGCAGCHDIAKTATTLSAPHEKHVFQAASLGVNFKCADCHAKTVALASDTVITNKAAHVNKLKNYSGVKAGKMATVNGQITCSASYCHSSGQLVPAFRSMTGGKRWNVATTTISNCNGCHGYKTNAFTAMYGEPNYANVSTAASPRTGWNSHQTHVNTGATDCFVCHANTTTRTGTLKAGGLHIDKSRQVNFSTSKATSGTASYSNGYCSNVVCHGGTGSIRWGGAALVCSSCHGNGATATSSDYATTFWNNGIISKIQMTGTGSWATGGHGATAATGSGNPGANLTSCEYCHDPASGHKDSTNAFRLKNYSTVAFGRNAPCLTCHATAGAGVDVGGVIKKRTTSGIVDADHFGGSHSTTYNGGQFCWDCHNPHGNGTSNLFMVRTNPSKVSNRVTGEPTTTTATAVAFTANATGTDYAKSAATFNGVCNVCHTYNAAGGTGFTKYYGDAAALTPAHNAGQACTDCHAHKGSATTRNDAFAGAGGCDGCHGYQVGSWTSKTERASLTVFEGKGNNGTDNANSHNKHITYLLSRYSAQLPTGLNPLTDQYNTGNSWTYVCGVCHNGAPHNMSEPIPGTGRQISIPTTYQFGASAPVYNAAGSIGLSSSASSKTCSNVSCHYFKSPVWSTY